MPRVFRLLFTGTVLMLLGCGSVSIPVVSDALDGLNLSAVREQLSTDAISTNFAAAEPNLALSDTFGTDRLYIPMKVMPRSAAGGYVLTPGFYELTCRSYCLKAGTHGPSSGDGHLYAPLAGKQAEVVQAIVRASAEHPEIAQQDVQRLLWAVIAKAKFSQLSPKLKAVSVRLLSPQQLAQLNGGALGLIPERAFRRAIQQLPAPAQRVLEAERSLRHKLYSASASYQELERLAVLTGAATVDRPDIARGRWSRHPSGYYVRYFPSGYRRTRVQVYVPTGQLPGAASGSLDRSPGRNWWQTREYDGSGGVAVPANTGSQRLLQSNEPPEEDDPGPCAGMAICIHHPVKHIKQRSPMSCWAAAGGMATGSPTEIGPGDAKVGENGGLDKEEANIRKFARSNGMKYRKVSNPSPQDMEALMREAEGPLWVAGNEITYDAEGTGTVDYLHVKVISSMQRETGSTETKVIVHDPAYDISDPDFGDYAAAEIPLDFFINSEMEVHHVVFK